MQYASYWHRYRFLPSKLFEEQGLCLCLDHENQIMELQGFFNLQEDSWIFASGYLLFIRWMFNSGPHWCNGKILQLSYLVIQNRGCHLFCIISIKPWGVAMARGVGGKREPCRRRKKNRERKRERVWEAPRYREKWLCLHEIRPRS